MQGIASYSQVVAQRKCPWGTTNEELGEEPRKTGWIFTLKGQLEPFLLVHTLVQRSLIVSIVI